MKVLFTTLLLALSVSTAANQYVFPKEGQSEEQQAKDEASCDDWASKQIGADLATLETQKQQKINEVLSAPAPDTKGVGARGAAKGAIVGSLAGRDKLRNETAAAGAVLGAASAKKQAQAQAAQAQSQATGAVEAEFEAKTTEYFKARSVCLESKGYNVK